MKSKLIPEFLKKIIDELPAGPGVYFFKSREGEAHYIGKAFSIKKRVLGHFRCYGENFSKEGKMLKRTRRIDFIQTSTEAEALLLEASLIKENQPKYNQELKDDKSYPFLKITNEAFPRLLVARGRKPDGAKYFGPYTSAHLLRQALGMLRRLFPMRTCHPIPKKVCLEYHIGHCKGPCVGEIGQKEYHEIVKELALFLEGRRDVLVKNLIRRMKEHSGRQEYEKAQVLYAQIKALSSVPVKSVLKSDAARILHNLQEVLSLPNAPDTMECFDISNISGSAAVGSMVVFKNAKPSRADYRKFRIKTVTGIDDYEMMREVIRRRYRRLLDEKKSLPDLVVIDGGKGHLACAKGVLDELGLKNLPIISIAKQHEHIFSSNREKPFVLPQNSPVLQLIQRLRDEAHRFAISYHRKLRQRLSLD